MFRMAPTTSWVLYVFFFSSRFDHCNNLPLKSPTTDPASLVLIQCICSAEHQVLVWSKHITLNLNKLHFWFSADRSIVLFFSHPRCKVGLHYVSHLSTSVLFCFPNPLPNYKDGLMHESRVRTWPYQHSVNNIGHTVQESVTWLRQHQRNLYTIHRFITKHFWWSVPFGERSNNSKWPLPPIHDCNLHTELFTNHLKTNYIFCAAMVYKYRQSQNAPYKGT